MSIDSTMLVNSVSSHFILPTFYRTILSFEKNITLKPTTNFYIVFTTQMLELQNSFHLPCNHFPRLQYQDSCFVFEKNCLYCSAVILQNDAVMNDSHNHSFVLVEQLSRDNYQSPFIDGTGSSFVALRLRDIQQELTFYQ